MSWVIKGSKPYVDLEDTDTAKKIRIQNDSGDTKIIDPSTGNEATINGVTITSHASRHNRGGADAIDWSSISRFRVNTGISASVGVSGSPATTALLTLDTNYYNLLPLTIKVTPSNLASGESLTVKILAVCSDGNTYTLASETSVTAEVTFSQADLDFTALADGVRITEIDISIESSATSTSATVTVDVSALEF